LKKAAVHIKIFYLISIVAQQEIKDSMNGNGEGQQGTSVKGILAPS
jgi:hypothetical protein